MKLIRVRLVLVTILAFCLLGVYPQPGHAQDTAPRPAPDVRSFAYQGSWWPCNEPDPCTAPYDAQRVSSTMVSGDFNGDRLAEIAALYDRGGSNSELHVWQSTKSSFFDRATWWAPGPGVFQGAAVKGRFVSGDFNGDGKDDIAGMYNYGDNKPKLFVWPSTGTSFGYEMWWEMPQYNPAGVTDRMVSGDFNGDGKDDIAAMYWYNGWNGVSTAIHVFLSTGSSFNYQGNPGWWQSMQGPGSYLAPNATGRFVSGDFNGDGRDDLAALYDKGGNNVALHVWPSRGSSFGYETWWEMSQYNPAGVTARMVSGDFNGDGKDDIAAMSWYDGWNGVNTAMHVFLSAGSSFNYQGNGGWWQSDAGEYRAPGVTERLVAGDFDDDGRADIAGLYDYGQSRAGLQTWLATGRSVRFLALSDVHSWTDIEPAMPPELEVLDSVIAKLPSSDAGSPYRGLIVAGDLINYQGHDFFGSTTLWNGGICTGCSPNWANDGGAYLGRIWYSPQKEYIYDGWGNHDMAATVPAPPGQPTVWQDIFDTLKSRVRKGQYPASEGGHYSWDWNGVHFVQLNLIAGEDQTKLGDSNPNAPWFDPRHSLTFLASDLAANARGDKPVVIVQHSLLRDTNPLENQDLLNPLEKQALLDILRPYRVVAFLYGHSHGGSWTYPYTVKSSQTQDSRTFYTVHPGSLYPDGYSFWSDITLTEGTCSVMTIRGYKSKNADPTGSEIVQFPDLDKPISTAQAVQGDRCHTQVTLTAVDREDPRDWGCSSGVRRIEYQLNGTVDGKWETYKPPLIVVGNATVYYRAVDKGGDGPTIGHDLFNPELDNVEDPQQLRIDSCTGTYLPMIKR